MFYWATAAFKCALCLIPRCKRVGRRKYSPIDPWKETANIACANNKPWRPWKQRGRNDSKHNVDSSHTTILAVAAPGPRGSPRSPTHIVPFVPQTADSLDIHVPKPYACIPCSVYPKPTKHAHAGDNALRCVEDQRLAFHRNQLAPDSRLDTASATAIMTPQYHFSHIIWPQERALRPAG